MKESEQRSIFENWLQQYQALLFKVVRAYAFNAEDQDDLFQEIAIQLWRSVPNFRGEAAATTWIYRVALNTALKWTRREQKHQDGRQSIDNRESLLREKAAANDERLDWLYQEIAKLNEVDRSLALLLLDGFSYREMAEMIGISESNIGVRIHRIKKHLIAQSKKHEYYGI